MDLTQQTKGVKMKRSNQFEKPAGFLAGCGKDEDGKNCSAIYLLSSIDETLKTLKRVYTITSIENDVPTWANEFNAIRIRFEIKQ